MIVALFFPSFLSASKWKCGERVDTVLCSKILGCAKQTPSQTTVLARYGASSTVLEYSTATGYGTRVQWVGRRVLNIVSNLS